MRQFLEYPATKFIFRIYNLWILIILGCRKI
jgi:hypothetical protein